MHGTPTLVLKVSVLRGQEMKSETMQHEKTYWRLSRKQEGFPKDDTPSEREIYKKPWYTKKQDTFKSQPYL